MEMQHTFDRVRTVGPVRHWPWALALVVCAPLALWFGWIGFIASDDSLYWAGAMKWLTAPPFAGDNHWSTRFPLTLTFAAMLEVVGQNFAAFAATALLFYATLVAATAEFARRVAGARVAWIAALLTATLPVVVQHASTVSVDLAEATALMLGALLLAEARDDRAGWLRGVAAGACFGVAVLCRETTVLSLVGFVPLFLLGRPVPRRVLIACGVGLAIVLGGEALYQYALTGEPLRRYTIAFHHDEHIDRAANMEGNFLLWPPIDPLLVLLVNDDFGLLFWVFAAAVAVGVRRYVPVAGRQRLTVLGAMAATSFVLVAVLVHKLVLNPRYFMLPALAAVIVVAAWSARLPAWRRAALLAAIVGSNVLLLGVGNAHPRWYEETLVRVSAAHPGEIIAANPQDVRRALIPMVYAHRQNLRYAPAAPGGLELVDPVEHPIGAGRVVATFAPPPTRVGSVVVALGLAPLVPAPIAHRLLAPGDAVVLVRRPRG